MKDKYVPYSSDGSGRDYYIGYDNGGFFSKNLSNSTDKNNKDTGTAFVTRIDNRYPISPSIKAPNFHYHADGNGRDSYIISNGGGLYYDSKSLNSYKLIDFLRNKEPIFTKSHTIDAESTRCSQNQMRYKKFLREKEKSIINRLYEQEKIKKKNLKLGIGKEEDNSNENPQTKCVSKSLVLPKLGNKQTRSFTEVCLKDVNEVCANDENVKKNENNEIFKNNLQTISHGGSKCIIHDHLLKNLEKLTKYDADKRYKKDNQNFNQAYLHLRNANYSTLNA